MHIQYKTLGKQQHRKKSFLPMYHLETTTANNFVLALSLYMCPQTNIHIFTYFKQNISSRADMK